MKRILWLALFLLLTPLIALADRAVQVDALYNGLRNSSGQPLAGGKVYTYDAGTTTARNLYTAQDKSVQATNPIILDSMGRAVVYGSGSYKFVVKTSADVQLWSADNLLYTVNDNAPIWGGTSTGSSNTYALSPSPTLTAYIDGLQVSFISNFANTGAATLNISALGAKSVKTIAGAALSGSEIANNQLVNVIYVSSAGEFRLIGQAGVQPVASGGTGASTVAGARANLSAAQSGTNADITSLIAPLSMVKMSDGSIFTNTSDGSDNSFIQIGHGDQTRGGLCYWDGNEKSVQPGQILCRTGDVAGANLTLATYNTTSNILFQTNNITRWAVLGTGHIEPQLNGAYDVGSTSNKLRNLYQAMQVWSPTITSDVGTIGSVTVDEANYTITGAFVLFQFEGVFTATVSAPMNIRITAPVAGTAHSPNVNFLINIDENTTTVAGGGRWRYDGTQLFVTKPNSVAFATGVPVRIHIDGKYKL